MPYRKHKGKNIVDFKDDYVVLDLETTGLSPEHDKIIEIGILKISNGRIVDQFQSLINPNRKIDNFIIQLTGITNEMLLTAPSIDTIFPLVNNFIDNNIIIGHNVNFDIDFLYDAYADVLLEPLENDFIDTMRISRKLYPELPHHRLIDLVEYLKIEDGEHHRALSDCNYTYNCYSKMKNDVINKYGSIDDFKSLFSTTHRYPKYADLRTIVTSKTEFNESHPLFKKVCVFTGTLEKYSREEAAQVVVNLGGVCENNVTKRTNYLVLGNNDYSKGNKSTKQKKRRIIN